MEVCAVDRLCTSGCMSGNVWVQAVYHDNRNQAVQPFGQVGSPFPPRYFSATAMSPPKASLLWLD